MGLGFGILGKYPFNFGKVTAFPLLGVEYRLALSVKDENGKRVDDYPGLSSGDFSAFWFQFGGGLDYALTDALYLRGSALYGIRLANKFEENTIDDVYDLPKTRLGHGPAVTVALGCKF